MKIGAPSEPRSRRKPKRIWHLATNQQNMLYMLAAGMVMGPAGFRGKHYADPLSLHPGWIPLFRDKAGIPAGALNHATSERKLLLPCVASFDLIELRGTLQKLTQDGTTRKIKNLGEKILKDELAILIRAPLPITLISRITFRSSEDKQAFVSNAGDVSNVDLSHLRLDISESLFSSNMNKSWPPTMAQAELFNAESDSDAPQVRGQALGGVLAMLYHLANRNDLGLAAYRLAADDDNESDRELVQSDPVLAGLTGWLKGETNVECQELRGRLFWGVVNSLVSARAEKHPRMPLDVSLDYLTSQIDQLQETEWRSRLERLIEDMRNCRGLGGGTVTELLERNKGSLSRPLILFCLREHCTDVLEFSHPLLTDAEYVLAGILFGVRDTWLQLPRELRSPELSDFVSHKMAMAEHRKLGNEFACEEPPRPVPIRELFVSPDGEWSGTQEEAALEVLDESEWNECIVTKIIRSKGEYTEEIVVHGTQVDMPGRIVLCTEVVDKTKFLRRLGQWPPPDRLIESKARKKLAIVPETSNKVIDSPCG